jgi:CO dehydrogenase/acetyl-CoA synthase delta subunit
MQPAKWGRGCLETFGVDGITVAGITTPLSANADLPKEWDGRRG